MVRCLLIRTLIYILELRRSPDGQCLILSSRDGYCTLVIFDEILPAYHTQQHTLQLQSIAHHHSVPLTYSSGHHSSSSVSHVTPAATPASTNVCLPFATGNTPSSISAAASQPNPRKRDPPLTPATSVDGSERISAEIAGQSTGESQSIDPPKKRRRVALTHIGDLES